MPIVSILEVVNAIKYWLRVSWVSTLVMLAVLSFLFVGWSLEFIDGTVTVEKQRIYGVLESAKQRVKGGGSFTNTSARRFAIDLDGKITQSSIPWLRDVDVSPSSLFRQIKGEASGEARLFFAPSLVDRKLAPHVEVRQGNFYQVAELDDFVIFNAVQQNAKGYLVNNNGVVLFADQVEEVGTTQELSLFKFKGGSIFYTQSTPLDVSSSVLLLVETNVSQLIFGTFAVFVLVFTGYFLASGRTEIISKRLSSLSSEFNAISEASKLAINPSRLAGESVKGVKQELQTMHNSLEALARLDLSYHENIRVVSLLRELIFNSIEMLGIVKNSEERFRLLSSLSPVGVFSTDRSGALVYSNAAMQEVFGVSHSQLEYDQWLSFFHDPGERDIASEWRDALKGSEEFSVHSRIINADGQSRYVYIEAVRDSNKDSQQGFIGAVVDMTDAKKAENALRESEARWQFALDGSQLGVYDWNIASGEVFYSNRYVEILGESLVTMRKQADAWAERLHPDDKQEVLLAVERHMNSEADRVHVEHRIRHHDGHYIWVRGNGKVIERDKTGQPLRMIGTMSDITDEKASEAQVQFLAYHDALTELPNRTYFAEQLELKLSLVKRYKRFGALLFLDLDNFKDVNDSLGHLVGDELLKEVKNRLQQATREGDIVARLGGDEFVIMLGNLEDDISLCSEHAKMVADKVIRAVSEPVIVAGHAINATTSIGIAVFPEDGHNADEVLRHADTALYQAKREGRNTYRFYLSELEESLRYRLAMEAKIRNAIKEDVFELYYQPQLNIDTGRVIGAEALLRWRDEDGSFISPMDFIPVAEDTGLIVPLGRWVVRSACKQLQAWKQQESFREFKRMAVNVSALQLAAPDFVETCIEIFEETGVNPEELEFEVTETAFMERLEDTRDKMLELGKLGVKIAVDDFGTGYSSLAYLKRLPIDVLKIDRTFVRDIATDQSDAVLVQTIIGMAHNLGLEVVAEGVEDEDQLAFIRNYQCDYFQGYLVSPPVETSKFEAQLAGQGFEVAS